MAQQTLRENTPIYQRTQKSYFSVNGKKTDAQEMFCKNILKSHCLKSCSKGKIFVIL